MRHWKRYLAALLALVMLLSAMTGCSSTETEEGSASPAGEETSSPAPEQSESTGTHTVVDITGASVEVPDEIDSIVSFVPAFTQILLALGAGEKVTAGSVSDNPLNRTMFPYTENVVRMSASDVNVETVMNVDPDVIIWGSSSSEVPEGLVETGVPIVRSNIASPDDLMAAVTLMGEVVGGEALEKAQLYTEFYQGLIEEISALTADIPEEEKPVLYFTASEDGLTSFGIESMVYNWATVSGARYSGEVLGIQEMRATLTAEQLIDLNPDIIVCTTNAAREMFLTSEMYAGLDAVVNEQVYVTPNGASVWYLGHVEAPLELTWAPGIVWPELADQLNTEERVRYFYETFYEYDLSEEEYQSILHPVD